MSKRFKVTKHTANTPLADGRIVYQEQSLARVCQFYMDNFEFKDEKLLSGEALVDSAKGVVVFKMILKNT